MVRYYVQNKMFLDIGLGEPDNVLGLKLKGQCKWIQRGSGINLIDTGTMPLLPR